MRERKRDDRSNLVKPNNVKPTVSALRELIQGIEDKASVKPVQPKKKYYELTPEGKGVTSYDGDGYPIYEE